MSGWIGGMSFDVEMSWRFFFWNSVRFSVDYNFTCICFLLQGRNVLC